VLVANMSLTEIAGITLGNSTTHGCSGFSGSVGRLGFPGICLQDAENGVRTGNLVNGYASQLSIGASWNRSLAYERALYLGKEFKGKSINVLLGPVVGPLGRVAKGGRNWEGFSNDPYLAGRLAAPTVSGLQRSVIACVKHAIANEQETNRQPFLVGFVPGLGQAVSSNVDDQTLHELYLWPLYDALRAGAGSVMCSYNRLNNSYACQNSKLMNGLLKQELGFQGFVVSDWWATQTGIAANKAGLDLVMPRPYHLSVSSLVMAINNGSLNASRLEDQATRILAAWYRFAPFQTPGIDNFASTDVRNPDADSVLQQSAIEGHVLVKNINKILPLNGDLETLSLFGHDAAGGINTSAGGQFLWEYGMANSQTYISGKGFGPIQYARAFAESYLNAFSGPEIALNGTLLSGGGSGAITPTSSTSPFDAIAQQCDRSGTTLHYNFASQNPIVQAPNDPCIVSINAQSSETWDRSGLSDDYSDRLVINVASQCSHTIVVIHNAGVRLVDAWIDHPNVTAVIFAHAPGQESGNALVDILYGRQSPSGRLPYTVAKDETDYGPLLSPTLPTSEGGQSKLYPQSDFSEGLFIDYRYFSKQGIAPRFPFGFGLTYSNFTYSAFTISKNSGVSTAVLPPDAGNASIPQGGLASLFDIVATASINVTNVGNVAAAEVAQLYVGVAGSSVSQVLRGFDKHLLQPGHTAAFVFPLTRRDLSVWDVGIQQWRLRSGPHHLMAGRNVQDIEAELELNL
jgi:beta-glucosidase